MNIANIVRWTLGGIIVVLLTVVPYLHHRHTYRELKRLRVVDPGKLYRSGAMLEDGFRDAIKQYGIRSVINLQNEAPDPDVPRGYWSSETILESDICEETGAKLIFMNVDLKPKQLATAENRPQAIDEYLQFMDDPKNHPVLIHCRAGLHRTGCLVAVYRMEYNGWSESEAMHELKANGFGDRKATSANEYIRQYVLNFRPGLRFNVSKDD